MSFKSSMNTVKKMNGIAYSKLSTNERFKLFIKSYVEEDDKQAQQLVETCPHYNFKIADPAFTKRVEFSRKITTVFILRFLEFERIVSINTLIAFTSTTEATALNKMYSRFLGFIEAFENFTIDYLGVDYCDLIIAWYMKEDYIQRIIKVKQIALNKVESIDEVTKHNYYYNVFVNGWSVQGIGT